MWNELDGHNPVNPAPAAEGQTQPMETLAEENSLEPSVGQLQIPQEDDTIVVPSLNFEGYQVVRQEFFAHMREPSLTFNNNRVYVNSYCLARLPNVVYVQYLVNTESRTLIIRPCSEGDKDAVAWCNIRDGKHRVKQVTGKVFTAMIMSMMKWNPLHRYKFLGKFIKSSTETVILFDLNIPEIYERTISEGEKIKTSRTPVMPPDVLHQFGLSFAEHQQLRQISIFDGYTVFGIKDAKTTAEEQSTETEGGNYDE